MKKKILIVDDDKIFVKILKDALVLSGKGNYDVFAAFDGEEGFTVAERERPDLVMIDILMPRLNGIEFLKKLRAQDWGKNTYAIMETGLQDFDKMSEVAALNVRGYFVKANYSIESIIHEVQEIFKAEKQA